MPLPARTTAMWTVLLLTAGLLLGGQALLPRDASAIDGPVPVVFIARADVFADALAAGPLASLNGAPILFTDVESLPESTQEELRRLMPERIVILGGTAAVSAAVEAQLAEFAGSGGVDRIGGGNRVETAELIAQALPERAADADLLDGMDSSDFLSADEADVFLTADDAAGFLTAGGLQAAVSSQNITAPNASRLDGLNSTDFADAESVQPFIVQLDTASATIVAENGPLTVAVACRDNGAGGVVPRVEVASSVDGARSAEHAGGAPFGPATGYVRLNDSAPSGTTSLFASPIDDGVAVVQSGTTMYVVAVDGETLGYAINEYGAPCTVNGIVNAYSAPAGIEADTFVPAPPN